MNSAVAKEKSRATATIVDSKTDDNVANTQNSLKLESMDQIQDMGLPQILRENCNLTSFQICDGVFKGEGFRSPTWKELRKLLQCISAMKNLEVLDLNGNMSIDNEHDALEIAKAISNHPSLRVVKLQDFVVYANDHADSMPLLESLVRATASISRLEELHLRCLASYKHWDRSYMTCRALIPFCQSNKLRRLALSNVGLGDDHLDAIGRGLAANRETVLEELILNNNKNTRVEAMVKLLTKNSTIQRIEVHNHRRVKASTCELLLQNLDKNRTIKHFHVNVPHEYRREIDFYLLLNRRGREVLLNPDSVPEEAIDILAASNGNVSVLMHMLRDNPSLCKTPEGMLSEETVADGCDLQLDAAEIEERINTDREKNVETLPMSRKELRTPNNLTPESASIWRGFWYQVTAPASTPFA